MGLEITSLTSMHNPKMNYSQHYRQEVVNQICSYSIKKPSVTFMKWSTKVPGNIIKDEKRFRRLFESCMNIAMFKFSADDTNMVVSMIKDRDEHFEPMPEVWFGEILLEIADTMVVNYGGNIKYWLICIFWNLGLYNKTTGYGHIFQEIAANRYFADSGYGIFGNPDIKITAKKMSFSKELALFRRQMDKFVVPF